MKVNKQESASVRGREGLRGQACLRTSGGRHHPRGARPLWEALLHPGHPHRPCRNALSPA